MNGPTEFDPQHWPEAKQWLERADEDLRLAQRIVRDAEFLASAAFHCQQAAEKMAKAVLVAYHAEYPRTHDLAELGTAVAAVRPELGESIAGLSGVTDWYVTSRYPGLEYRPSRQDVELALEKLNDLRQQIAALAPKPSE